MQNRKLDACLPHLEKPRDWNKRKKDERQEQSGGVWRGRDSFLFFSSFFVNEVEIVGWRPHNGNVSSSTPRSVSSEKRWERWRMERKDCKMMMFAVDDPTWKQTENEQNIEWVLGCCCCYCCCVWVVTIYFPTMVMKSEGLMSVVRCLWLRAVLTDKKGKKERERRQHDTKWLRTGTEC